LADVRAFDEADVKEAAALLVERHELNRAAQPLLAPLEDGREEVTQAWKAEGAAGAIALVDGRVAAYLIGSVRENEWWYRHVWVGLAGHAAVAATLPEARGTGAGVALTERALAWAKEAGYETVQTDWRVANLESSRFWPRRGFRETFYRLARRVNIG